MTSKTTTLTTIDLNRATGDDRWGGFGYLGERARSLHLGLDVIATVDAAVLAVANGDDWDYEALFTWADSKTGRWFGDAVFGQWDTGLPGEQIEALMVRAYDAGLI